MVVTTDGDSKGLTAADEVRMKVLLFMRVREDKGGEILT